MDQSDSTIDGREITDIIQILQGVDLLSLEILWCGVIFNNNKRFEKYI